MRFERKLYGLLLATLLFAGMFFALAPLRTTYATSLVPQQEQLILRSNYYEYLEVQSFSNNTWVAYNVTSSSPISVAFMTLSQLDAFSNTSSDDISNSITYQNTTSVVENLQVPSGEYFLVFYAYGSRALVDYGYDVYPNTPYSYGPVPAPEASGIASYGITNDSGVAVPYEVETSQIVGVANISSVLANNPQAPSYGDNVAGMTLQLNTNLVVNETNGLQDIYWVQNTPDFVTSNNVVSLTDNIWNNTDLVGMLTNQSITSTNFANGGAVYTTTSEGVTSYAYLFSENNVTYKLPFSFALVENETVEKGTGVLVQLGFRDLQNGTLTTSPTFWYDNVTIHVPNVESAYYEVAGNATTPIGSFFDSEFVFAGEGNFESTQFLDMSASLGLFYYNESTGSLSSFPTYYSFGADTGESVTNLAVNYSNGIAYVTVGNPNYVYLGGSTLTLPSDYKLPSSIFSAPSTSGASSTTTQTTQSSTTAVSLPVPASNNDLLYAAAAVALVMVVVVAAVLAMRKGKPFEQTVQTFPQTTKTCPYCGTVLPPGAIFCSQCGQAQQPYA